MDTGHRRLDPFAITLAGLGALTLGFVGVRNGAAVVMCALCIAGLLAARLAGFSNRALVPLTLGVIVILWIVWVDSPAGSRTVSAVAHGAGGVLVGWALADYLRARLSGGRWALAAVAGVLALTLLWELGEYLGDALLTTALDPSRRDSSLDVFFGALGGAGAVALARLLLPASGGDRRGPIA